MLTTLTKQNFWNYLEQNCPTEMAAFKNWIDEYKKKVNWDMLFCNGDIHLHILSDEKGGKTTIYPHNRDIKYHDLPIAMQIGIFIQYCMETPHRYELLECLPPTMGKLADHISSWMQVEESVFADANEDRPE